MARENNAHRMQPPSDEGASREPRYVITAVASRVGVRVQTLRRYEEYGLLEPARSASGSRLYSDADIAEIQRIRRLVDDLGINLAGVAAVLHLRAQLLAAQQELRRMQSARVGR